MFNRLKRALRLAYVLKSFLDSNLKEKKWFNFVFPRALDGV